MKSLIAAVALAFCLPAGVVGASAQQNLNFANLPLVNSPAPMPKWVWTTGLRQLLLCQSLGMVGRRTGLQARPAGCRCCVHRREILPAERQQLHWNSH